MDDILGVILAGGLSRRMNGREKSFLKLKGKPLISHVIARLGDQTKTLLINANGEASRFSELGLPVQSDTVDGYAGPLAGVLAGMRWAQENSNANHIITAAADTPFFPLNYVNRMVRTRHDCAADIALAASNNQRHPVFGLWPIRLADDLEHFLLDEENRKVMLFVDRYENCLVDFDGASPDPFFNVNTPEDLAQAEKICGEMELS